MDVSTAVASRKSVRAFTTEQVPNETILELLERASRAPSGGNLQPWRVAVLNGERMKDFKAIMEERLAGKARPGGDTAQYAVYPPGLGEPYRSLRHDIGERMYALLGIAREDRAARLGRFADNFRFFGAPAAIFCLVSKDMGSPQWSDLGMFLQTFMLLAQERGLATCAQECWATFPDTVLDFCEMDRSMIVFCAIALGHEDKGAPVNRLQSPRQPLDAWVKVL
jgi:nitroreductase